MDEPSYLKLHRSGELVERVRAAVARLSECRLCPRDCGVDRTAGERGFCAEGRWSHVAGYNPHFGEEEPLVGESGSGTIFFAGCNLSCSFCQNRDISKSPSAGLEASPDELAGVMLELKKMGCANINFVTPSHVVPQILEALPIAAEHGLDLPLVYNSGGYDEVETLRLLDGIVDIYMPDAKFWDGDLAARFLAGARDYPEQCRTAIREMHRQVGDLVLDQEGMARRGLLVRHLVMPSGLAGTGEWMRFLAREISPDTYVNVMDQYRPCGPAREMEEIGRSPTRKEQELALRQAGEAGLSRLDERTSRITRFLNLSR